MSWPVTVCVLGHEFELQSALECRRLTIALHNTRNRASRALATLHTATLAELEAGAVRSELESRLTVWGRDFGTVAELDAGAFDRDVVAALRQLRAAVDNEKERP